MKDINDDDGDDDFKDDKRKRYPWSGVNNVDVDDDDDDYDQIRVRESWSALCSKTNKLSSSLSASDWKPTDLLFDLLDEHHHHNHHHRHCHRHHHQH